MEKREEAWNRAFDEASEAGTDIDALERKLALEPDDAPLRAKVVAAHYTRFSAHVRLDPRLAAHAVWWIENHPRSEIAEFASTLFGPPSASPGHEQVLAAWERAVAAHADDPRVLASAARFFTDSDHDLALALYERARALDPQNPMHEMQLGKLELLRGTHGSNSADPDTAQRALAHFEAAIRLQTDDALRILPIQEACKIAVDAGEIEKARTLAEELLQRATRSRTTWDTGNALHQGNLVLGRVALRNGDVERAKKHLLAAARVEGSPQLSSFGPNMQLAKELLERGEREVVIEYLGHCAAFWKDDRGQLEFWKTVAANGKVPNFGANLVC